MSEAFAVKLVPMNFKLTAPDRDFLKDVRQFLAETWPTNAWQMPGPRQWRDQRRFIDALAGRGWLTPQWPVAAGGAGWSPRQRLLWEQELAAVCGPQLSMHGADLIGPLLQQVGTYAQQERHLPAIARGDVAWCPALGEDSGALDLAQIQCRATPIANINANTNPGGGYWRLDGTKPWVLDVAPAETAEHNWFCVLAEMAGKRGEYSLFLVDSAATGVAITPRPMIGELAGQHRVHSLTLDNVLVGAEDVLGAPGSGGISAQWLEQEALCRPGLLARNRRLLTELRAMAQPQTGSARDSEADPEGLWQDEQFRVRLHALEVELEALEVLEARAYAGPGSGAASDPLELRLGVASKMSPLNQKLADLQMDALGYFALPFVDFSALDNEGPIGPEFSQPALLGMLSDRARAAVSAPCEHLKNIIAKSVLKLPDNAVSSDPARPVSGWPDKQTQTDTNRLRPNN